MGSNLTLHKYTNRFYEIHQTKNEEKPASGVPLCGTKTKNSILRLKSAGEPSQRASQTSFLPIGGAFWLKSELFLTKIRTANFDAPPRHRSLMLATPQKSFLHFSRFARPRFFLLKGKENFFAGFCSERAGRRDFASARARRNSPPTPPSASPLLELAFFSADLESVFYKAKCAARDDVALVPTHPCTGNDKELP